MSVNLAFGISEKKTKHLGVYFSSIDFEVFKCSKRQIETQADNTIVGNFWINDRSQKINLKTLQSVINDQNLDSLQLPTNITKSEVNRIIETFYDANHIFWQKVRLNV
jgi:hypothetical protein